jgi:hypothetical protein
MFLSTFNASYDKYGEEKAFKIAWASVKKKFKKKINGLVLLVGTNTLLTTPTTDLVAADPYSGLWHPAGANSATFGLHFTNQWRLNKTP